MPSMSSAKVKAAQMKEQKTTYPAGKAPGLQPKAPPKPMAETPGGAYKSKKVVAPKSGVSAFGSDASKLAASNKMKAGRAAAPGMGMTKMAMKIPRWGKR